MTRETQAKSAPGYIARREPFTLGALSGARANVGNLSRLGALPSEWRATLADHAYAYGREVYVIWSFDTPIAWVLPGNTVVIPPVRYSLTTGQHQRLTADALGVPMPEITLSLMTRKRRNPAGAKSWQARQYGSAQ